MIVIWNRREVFVANSMQLFNEIRDKLIARNIDYTYRSVSNGGARSGIGMNFINLDYAYTYYLYVHKNDYDAAVAAINSRSY